MREAARIKIKKTEAKLGRKLTKRSNVNFNLKKALRVTDLGNGFVRFSFAPVALPPYSFRSSIVTGNGFNLISGSWIFTGSDQGFLLNNYSTAEDRWLFTAWNPTGTARTVTYAVIAKRKP